MIRALDRVVKITIKEERFLIYPNKREMANKKRLIQKCKEQKAVNAQEFLRKVKGQVKHRKERTSFKSNQNNKRVSLKHRLISIKIKYRK